MKSSIGRKILTLILVPFIIIFASLFSYTAYSISRYSLNLVELELKGIAEINAEDLGGRIYSTRISVLSAADVLSTMERSGENSRTNAENVILAMFENRYIYNAWLAYEPQAFDGRDAEFPGDYPGAPSGRFMRSFVVEDGEIIVAPDMDERTIDDIDESPWYAYARNTGKLYIDTGHDPVNVYDYKLGGEPMYTLSIAAPVHDGEGRVIGCVGADVLLEVSTFGIDDDQQAAVAVFYPNGNLLYSPIYKYSEESVDTLSFGDPARIKAAIQAGETLFLKNEYSVFLEQIALSYFQPIRADNLESGNFFIYVAIPLWSVYMRLLPVYVIMIAVIAITLLLLLAMFIYVTGRIVRPLRDLTRAADAISQGNLEAEIASFSDKRDEIGLLSRSLQRMVEQFRIYIISLRQSQAEMSVQSQIKEFIKSGDDTVTLGRFSGMLCESFGLHKASVVFIDGGMARAVSGTEQGHAEDFLYHTQVTDIIANKKMVFLNSYAISQLKISFLCENTISCCIVPLCKDGTLYGYMVLENNGRDNLFNESSESLLMYIAGALTEWLCDRDNRASAPDSPEIPQPEEEPAKEPDTADPLAALRGIDGLDADSAVEAMGGLTEIYCQSVRLLARLLPANMDKLDNCLNTDIDAFAIEIHGLKGSLNNIGAYGLGSSALRLEKASKAGDTAFCANDYPAFRASLEAFSAALGSALGGGGSKKPGDAAELVGALAKAETAAADFDTMEALDSLRPLADFSFGAEADALLREATDALETFECETALESIRMLITKIIPTKD